MHLKDQVQWALSSLVDNFYEMGDSQIADSAIIP